MGPEQWNEERGRSNSIIPIKAAAEVGGLPLYECLLYPELERKERKWKREILKGGNDILSPFTHIRSSERSGRLPLTLTPFRRPFLNSSREPTRRRPITRRGRPHRPSALMKCATLVGGSVPHRPRTGNSPSPGFIVFSITLATSGSAGRLKLAQRERRIG